MERTIVHPQPSDPLDTLRTALTTLGRNLRTALGARKPKSVADPDREQLLTDAIEREMITRELHCW